MRQIFLVILTLNGCLNLLDIEKNKSFDSILLNKYVTRKVMEDIKELIESTEAGDDFKSYLLDLSDEWDIELQEALNLKDKDGKTSLMYVADVNIDQFFRVLVDHGAIPRNMKEYCKGSESLNYAVRNRKIEVIDNMLTGLDLNGQEIVNALKIVSIEGIIDILEFLIKRGIDIDKTDFSTGRSAIMWAAQNGKKDIIEMLIENSANLNLQDYNGDTVLHLACSSEYKFEDMLKMLILSSSNVNKVNKKNESILMVAIKNNYSDELLEMLIERTLDLDIKDEDGMTAIMYAVCLGRYNIVEILIDKIQNIDDISGDLYENKTIISLATYFGHKNLIDLILKKGININTKNCNKKILMYNAVASGNLEIVKKIFKMKIDLSNLVINGESILMIAVKRIKSKEITKFLIENGADLDFLNREKNSVLSILANEKGNEELINLLIEKRVNLKNTLKSTEDILLLGIENEYVKLIEILLKHRFDSDYSNKNNINYITKAIKIGNRGIVDLLLKYDINLNDSSNIENNPLFCAIFLLKDKNMALKLIKKGANIKLIKEASYQNMDKLMKDLFDELGHIGFSRPETLIDESLARMKKDNFKNQTKVDILNIFKIFSSYFSIAEIIRIIEIFKLKEKDLVEYTKESNTKYKDSKVLEKLKAFCEFYEIDIRLIFSDE